MAESRPHVSPRQHSQPGGMRVPEGTGIHLPAPRRPGQGTGGLGAQMVFFILYSNWRWRLWKRKEHMGIEQLAK